MLYEFRCLRHPEQRIALQRDWRDQDEWTHGKCSICGEPLELDMGRGVGHRSFFRMIYGKETGIYEFDNGKKATWDLTPPGKMERLKKAGRIRDPFDFGAPPVTNDDLVPEI